MQKLGVSLNLALSSCGMSKSSYYYQAKVLKRQARPLDPKLMAALGKLSDGYESVYGYRKVDECLKAKGFSYNHKKILRHMRVLGLTQKRKIKGERWNRPRVVKPTAPNTYWEMDFSYVWIGTGNAYACPVIDAWDKDLVGDVFSDRCRAIEACQALSQAVMNRFGGRVPENHILTLRVDRGPQFISRKFKETAKVLNVTLEYAGIQCPEDKPYIESFFGKYKTEEVYRNEYESLSEARSGWESYRAWYKFERLHQSLGYQSPKSFQKRGLAGVPLKSDEGGGTLTTPEMEIASNGDGKKLLQPARRVEKVGLKGKDHNLWGDHFSPV